MRIRRSAAVVGLIHRVIPAERGFVILPGLAAVVLILEVTGGAGRPVGLIAGRVRSIGTVAGEIARARDLSRYRRPISAA